MILTFADLIETENANPPLSTLCPHLDDFLGGGIPWGRLIHISGTAGSGKSQLCMQLAASLKKHHPNKATLFLSGGKDNFLPDRYLELCHNLGVAGGDDVLFRRVLVSKATNFQSLMVALENALKATFEIGLILVESFGELIKDDSEKHFMYLDVLGKKLVEIAYEKKCIIICVNNATSRPTDNGSFQLVSALGAEWSLYSAFRLFMLCSTNPDHSKIGTLTLKKWPTATVDNWRYKITVSVAMRFTAIADDSKSVEALITAISSAAKYSKVGIVSVKILPSSLHFVCATAIRNGYFMEIKMEQHEVFSAFHMEGLAPDNNAIVFDMDLTQLMQAMTIKEEATKWKLVKRNNQPHLAIEMRVNAILKYIPVTIQGERSCVDYYTPKMNDPIVGLSVSPLKPFERLVKGFKQFDLDTMVMQVFPAGVIFIKSDCGEVINYNATITNLPILEDIEYPQDSDIIRLDTTVLATFFSALPPDLPRFSIRVTDLGQIRLSAKFHVLDFSIYMRTLREEVV